jgi:DNA-binding IclR family transcriptional regulator
LRLIQHLADNGQAQSPSTLAKALRIPLPSLNRILRTLADHGLVTNDAGQYSLTRRFWSLGARAGGDVSLIEASLGQMRVLRDLTRETVVISVLDGQGGLILEQVSGLHLFRFVIEPGTRQALHASASTKAILAFLPTAEAESLIGGCNFTIFTAKTLADAPALHQELAQVRASGVAFDHGEMVEGVHCLAAPIFDRHQRPIAALTVSGPHMRMGQEVLDAWSAPLKDSASRINATLGENAQPIQTCSRR